MKKMIKKICLFIGKIIRFFDKILITPIMKLFIKASELFNKNNKTIEKLFANKQFLIIISLLLAFLTYYAVEHNVSSLVDNSADILYGQPVKAIYNEESYVIEGLPESVDVILIGRKSDIYLAKQKPNKEGISVDLRGYSTGAHKVSLKYRQELGSVNYKIDPSTITVIINDKVSSTREVTAELLHRNNLDSKLDINDISLSKTEVTIRGSAKKLETVAYVKALIDIDDLVEPTVGKTTINNNKLVAYNNVGEIVDVEILPEMVDAEVTITSTSKVVPIKVVPIGDIALGYAVKTATLNISNITIYGDEEALKTIEYVPVKVDVTNLSSTKEFNVNLEKPTGVRAMSEKTVSVKVEIAAETQKEIKNISVTGKNLPEGLKVQGIGVENSTVSVIVKGSKEAIDALDTSSIQATIDLSECNTPGTYEVDVLVTGSDLTLTYTSKTKKVKVEVYK